MTCFVPSPDVLAAEVDDLLVVLDLRSEEYGVCDEVATTMWRCLVAAGDRAGALERLRAIYDAPPSLLERDLDALLGRLAGDGYARWAPAPVEPPDRTRHARRSTGGAASGGALTLRAWASLARTSLRLRRRGFAAAYRAAGASADATLPRTDADLLDRGVRAFARSENAFLIRSAPRDCLPRSLALFTFLRSIGVAAEHRIGVCRFPFRAHAWVEYDGRVLLDHPGLVAAFTPIARLPR